MYSLSALNEAKQLENKIVFDDFTNEDAFRLSMMIYDLAAEKNLKICWQVVIDNFAVVKVFLTGTDESNVVWLERKKNTVLASQKSSLRCGMEAELEGKIEPWYSDEENYVIRGGGVPIRKADGSFVGALCISGLVHFEDHALAFKVLEEYCKTKNGAQI